MSLSLPSHAISDSSHLAADHLAAMRGVVSSVWHGLWHAASTSPWVAIAITVPAVVVLVACTRVSARRGD